MPDDAPESQDAKTIRELISQAGLTARIDHGQLPDASHPDKLGRYPVTGHLGAGGMGEVLQVRDEDVGREVAAKVVLGEADGPMLAKFILEARVTGQLEHPNIVPMHELGMTHDGRVYFTMKRVEGEDLERLLDGSRGGADRSIYEYLQIFLKVCDAVAFAHSRGVIHRDLKPANIMVGRFGEVQLMDWGMAKVTGQPDSAASGCTLALGVEGPLKTLDGTIVGTPAYMPPEQAEGRIDQVDQRSDIYALGSVLYELLTLEPPYTGDSAWTVLDQVIAGQLAPPSQRAPGRNIPWELETVVLKAAAHRKEERYQTVEALKGDLERFLAGQTLGAARYSAWQILVKWGRRNQAAVLAGLAVCVIAIGLTLTYLVKMQSALQREADLRAKADDATRVAVRAKRVAVRERGVAARERDRARSERDRARDEERKTVKALALAHAKAAEVAANNGDALLATFLAARSIELADNPQARELFNTHRQRVHTLINTLRGHRGAIRTAVYDPAGLRILTASTDRTARLWDASSGKQIAVLRGHTRLLRGAVFDKTGARILTWGEDSTARLWDATTGRSLQVFRGHRDWVVSASFSPDGRRVLTASADKTARIWDVASGKELRRLGPHVNPLRQALFSPDGRRIATHCGGQGSRLWVASTGKLIKAFELVGFENSLALSADGKRLVMAKGSGAIRLFEASTGRRLAEFKGKGGAVWAVFSRDGKELVSGWGDGTVRVWDARTGKERMRFGGRAGWLLRPEFSADGKRMLTVSTRGIAQVWDLATGKPLGLIASHRGALGSATYSPDNKQILTASSNPIRPGSQTAQLWSDEAGSWLAQFPTRHATFNPDGSLLQFVTKQGEVVLWDTARQTTHSTLTSAKGKIYHTSFTPDGKSVLTQSVEDTVRLWSIATGKPRITFQPKRGVETTIVLSADGRRILTTAGTGTAEVWDAATGKRLALIERKGLLSEHGTTVFSPDGGLIASETSTGKVSVYHAISGKRLYEVNTATQLGASNVMSIRFSRDGRWIATLAGDIMVWSARTGFGQCTIEVHGNVFEMTFSPDSNQLLTATDFSGLALWDVRTGKKRHSLGGRMQAFHHAEFSSDRRRIIAVSSKDNSIRVFDAATRKLVASIRGPRARIWSATISPNGQLIVADSAKGPVRLWRNPLRITPRQAMLTVRLRTGMLLTGMTLAPEPQMQVPPHYIRLAGAIDEATVTALRRRFPTSAAIEKARDAVLSAADPAGAWLALYRELAGTWRANARRLFVREALLRALARRSARKRPVLHLALTRPADVRKKARALLASGHTHPLLKEIARD